ncbi:MAG: hypothetical protein Kow0031_17800 [Anaerolineae bacterium]
MNVLYRTSFLRDLKKLKRHKSDYDAIFTLAFDTLPQAGTLQDLAHVKPLSATASVWETTALAWNLKAMRLNWCGWGIAATFTAISPKSQ